MASRRVSAVSTKSLRQQKHSTERHQRQADLSWRIEEGQPLCDPPRYEQEAALSFRQDLFSELQPGGVGTLTRADTGPSQLEAHLGHRSDYFPIDEQRADLDTGRDVVRPWREPTAEEQEAIERRFPVVERIETGCIDPGHATTQNQLSTLEAKQDAGLLRQFYNKLRRTRVVKLAASQGLKYSTLPFTASATLWHKVVLSATGRYYHTSSSQTSIMPPHDQLQASSHRELRSPEQDTLTRATTNTCNPETSLSAKQS